MELNLILKDLAPGIKEISPGHKKLQQDLDAWLGKCNRKITHQGKRCQGRTATETFLENLPLAKGKMLGNEVEHRLALAA
jgi:hypothetical protein